MLSVELKNLVMAFVSVALYVFFLLVIFLAMEPFVLQPHAGEMRYVGRGEAKENKKINKTMDFKHVGGYWMAIIQIFFNDLHIHYNDSNRMNGRKP